MMANQGEINAVKIDYDFLALVRTLALTIEMFVIVGDYFELLWVEAWV